MPTVVDAASAVIRVADAVSPRLGARLAFDTFFSTSPRLREQPRDADVMRRAETGWLEVRGRRIPTYRWGEQGPVVVLVHGWRGRASQFASLIDPLREAGYRVVAFDAPGHGAAARGRTDVRDWLAALESLQWRHGRLRALVGHSFGGFASITAARHGIRADAVVSIAGTGTPAAFLGEFARMTRLRPATAARLEERFVRHLGETPVSFAERYDALAHPLPELLPLLLVHGTADRQLPAEASRLLQAAHPSAELLLLDGVGHTRVLSAPETRDAVLAHLARAAIPAHP
ncbi:alpha/beta fold hydrolase [Protaetiibacter intestinalis]|nr:alpha/beta fold hydrolase [Protaetiibacter intestinalis]